MDEPKDGGLAFPGVRYERTGSLAGKPVYGDVSYSGMTLRDWFAGQALAGLCANPDWTSAEVRDAASEAYDYADAMLAVRGDAP